MKKITINQFPTERWLFLFIVLHFIGWTIVPALVRLNLPLDAIEGTIWGHQLELGYDKNPFMNGWLTALATYLDGGAGWMLYVFSQLSVAACFWVIWRLAKTMLTPAYALISVAMLEGVQYYNFHAIDFNDNTLEVGLWALTIYCFYFALRSPKTRWWLGTGIFAGLAMMAKYYTLALLAGMFLLLITKAENRRQLATVAPYLGLTLFLAILLPHAVWLCFHDFITVRYVFERGSGGVSFWDHFNFPMTFAWQQFLTFLPALVLFAVTLIGKRPIVEKNRMRLSANDKAFLFWVGLGPLLLTLVLSLCLRVNLRAGWGTPLLSLVGIIIVAWVQPALTPAKLRRFIAAAFITLGLLLGGYTLSLVNSTTTSSANFPGKLVAATITKEWHDHYNTPLTYVAGSRWIGGNVGFYSKDKPAVFVEWKVSRSPWVDVDDLKKRGGIFVWEISADETLPHKIKKRFPRLLPSKTLTFEYLRNRHDIEPVKIGIAVLPPEPVMPAKAGI